MAATAPVAGSVQWSFPGTNEDAAKRLVIIFYGTDAEAAKKLASRIRESREGKSKAQLRDASAFWGEVEPCDSVVVMPSVLKHHAAKVFEAYGARARQLSEDDLDSDPGEAPRPPLDLAAKLGRVDLEKMTNRQLREVAVAREIDVSRAHNKEALVATILAAVVD